MANFGIITNNPMAAAHFPGVCTVADTDVHGIFTRARDAIHLGAVLLAHPLSGSVKPNVSPYKSLVLSLPGGELDMPSLQLIEGAMAVLKALGPRRREYLPQVLEDFQAIDLDLLRSAIKGLPPHYHI